MNKEFCISLIAGAALFCAAMVSIAGAFDGRIAFNEQPDGMVAQLYTSNAGSGDRQEAMLDSKVAPPASNVAH